MNEFKERYSQDTDNEVVRSEIVHCALVLWQIGICQRKKGCYLSLPVVPTHNMHDLHRVSIDSRRSAHPMKVVIVCELLCRSVKPVMM